MNNKTVIITGASRGIGAAAARLFAKKGANVVLAARNQAAIEKIAEEIGGLAVACDVSDHASVQKLIEKSIAKFGQIDVLINNAGLLGEITTLETSDPLNWGQVIDVNVKGVYYPIRETLAHMKGHGGGTIINVGSGAANSALEGWSAYCTSKAAVHHMTACLDHEERDNGIRAFTMSPGTVATDMQRQIRDSGVNPVSQISWDAHIPAEWAAHVFLWLCTPKADAHRGLVVKIRGDALEALVAANLTDSL